MKKWLVLVLVLVLIGIMVLWAAFNPTVLNLLLVLVPFIGRLLYAILFMVLAFGVLIWFISRPRWLKRVQPWFSLLVDREKLDEKLEKLVTRDEFFAKMDEVMGELKTIREE